MIIFAFYFIFLKKLNFFYFEINLFYIFSYYFNTFSNKKHFKKQLLSNFPGTHVTYR